MIKDLKTWREWETKWQKSKPVDIEENFRVFEELMRIARDLGKWPPQNPLEGIEVDIKIARIINTYVEKSSG
jgi:hypothetical protein